MASLPQDSRGPHRQQRWVECQNVGAEIIPAYGVVQVDSATRSELQRTIVSVKRPTADGHCNIMINSLKPIPIGGYGVCTNDFPTYALYAGDTPATSEIWGSKAGAFTLKKNKRGFIILGDADGTKVRINRDPTDWIIAEAILDQDLCTQTSQIQVINAKLWPRCIEFTPDNVTNSRRHRGKSGFKVLMARKACAGADPCGGAEEWDIFDVQLEEVCVVVGLDDRPSCLVAAGLKTALEWCPNDQPVTACVIVNYIDCDTTLPACDTDWNFAPLYACCGQSQAAGGGAGGGGGGAAMGSSTGGAPTNGGDAPMGGGPGVPVM